MIDEITRISKLVADATIEITPKGAAKIDNFQEHLKLDSEVFVTFLPGSDFADTLSTVEKLQQQGMKPIPHIAARSIVSKEILNEMLGHLSSKHQITHALLIGGGVDEPLGPFASTIEVLETGFFQKHGFTQLGIAGHPEGSPDISTLSIKEALLAKNEFAISNNIGMYITTQFCFEMDPIIAWEKTLNEWGNQLPIHIGLPGLATIQTLLRHAQACGIGNSMRVLTQQAKNITKLLSVNAPDKLVRNLANHVEENTASGIKKCHVYPLGGFAKSAQWITEVQNGKIALTKTGFNII